jgi:hypothetical protein
MRDAGFDVSFRDCPAKGGTGGHPNQERVSEHTNALHMLRKSTSEFHGH